MEGGKFIGLAFFRLFFMLWRPSTWRHCSDCCFTSVVSTISVLSIFWADQFLLDMESLVILYPCAATFVLHKLGGRWKNLYVYVVAERSCSFTFCPILLTPSTGSLIAFAMLPGAFYWVTPFWSKDFVFHCSTEDLLANAFGLCHVIKLTRRCFTSSRSR